MFVSDRSGHQPLTPGEISVVVSADDLRHWLHLRMTLRALLAQAVPVAEVVLAVDWNDHLVSVARAVFPQLRVVANTAAPGQSATRIAGARRCSGRVVAFLGDSAAVLPDWSQQVAEAFDAPHVVAVGRAMRGQRPRTRPSWWPPEIPGLSACRHRGLALGVPLLTAMVDADLCLRSDVLWQHLLRDDVDATASTRCVNVRRGAGVALGVPAWTYEVATCLDAARNAPHAPDVAVPASRTADLGAIGARR